MSTKRYRVAALASVYFSWSHADVILSQVFRGYPPDFREGPHFEVASLYVEQRPRDGRRVDLSRDIARQRGIRLCGSVEEALTLGSGRLAVDGVLSIFEHGDYPKNRYDQTLYPRRRVYGEIVEVFTSSGRSVPVFNDKHLSVKWDEALWMVETSRGLGFPLMAGSSVPLSYRNPDVTLPMGCEIEEAVAVGYGHLEHYGFHALECLQSMVERRHFGGVGDGGAPEQGVRAVRTHYGAGVFALLDGPAGRRKTLEAALGCVESHARGDVREVAGRSTTVFEVEYRDGLRAFVVMPEGWIYEGPGGAFTFAAKLKGEAEPVATHFYLDQRTDYHPHFALLVRAIDGMFRTGHAVVPVERTLLTGGILEMALRSKHRLSERIETPHLSVRYRASDWPHGGAVPEWLRGRRGGGG